MPDRLIELAIEALESRKAAIDAEIAQLREELGPVGRRRRIPARRIGKRPPMSAAARKALGERMKARWVKWRAERATKASRTRKPANQTKRKPKQEEKPTVEKKS
jgi:hypothetical protein